MHKRFLRVKQAWRRYDRRYGWKWRALNAVAICLVVVGTVVPIASQMLEAAYYNLSSDALALVGKTDPTLLKQLSYTAADSTYQFNQKSVATASAASLNNLKQQVGTASGHGSDTSLYGLDVPTNYAKGVTYHDINSQLSFTMAPQFSAGTGKQVDGHLVFPLSLSTRAVYTLKNNGLKEDIVVSKARGDSMSFDYKLQLPKTLEAHKLADGSIGVYSADPSLYGTMSYGTAADRAAIQKARETGEKTHLVFGLPAPVVKNAHGQPVADAHFDLNGSNLRVVATGLDSVKGTFTIDPSVVVTSASDFSSGNNEGMISFPSGGGVSRGGLTGGSIGAWTSTGSLLTPTAEYGMGHATYNGYLYTAGGSSSSGNTDVYYASVNSDGTLGSWVKSANSFSGGRYYPALEAYNGYLYLYGGVGSAGLYGDVQYAKINSDGSVGTWTTNATSMGYGVCRFGHAVYNGYLYAVGGGVSGASTTCSNATTPTNQMEYAPINADGTVGSWTTSSQTFTNARTDGDTVAYNGYLYLVGGTQNYSPSYYDTQYAKIQPNGDIGAWQTSVTTLSQQHIRDGMTVYNGYIYLIGANGGTNTNCYYAQINANGDIGPWMVTSANPGSYWGEATFAYNGYLYQTDGNSGNGTYYAKINPPGTTTSYSTTTALSGTDSVVTSAGTGTYNGYIYMVGGYNGTSYIATTHYAPLNANGTIGTWNTTSALNTAAGDAGLAFYNGYAYVVGGTTGTGGTYTASVQYAKVNSDGTLGTWATTTSLNTAQGYQHAAAYNGYLYVVDGSGGGASTHVAYASINANGTVNAWSDINPLNTARTTESFIAYGGYLYAIGGTNLSSAEYAKINADGTLGTWTNTSSMSVVRAGSDAFVANGYMYMVGGDTVSSGSETATVEYAPINADGSLGTWQPNTSMAGTVHRGQISYCNGYVYSVSGKIGGTRVSTSYYASINDGGSGGVGTWQNGGNNFTTARYGAASAAYNGYLYIIGGYNSGYLNDVQYAKLNDGGSIGTWQNGGNNFTTGRDNLAAQVYNGYLYILGGQGVGGARNDVQYAQLNSDGSVGTWATSTNTFSGTRIGEGSAIYNGYIYVLGGVSAGYLNDVQYAKLNSDGSVGTWASTTNFSGVREGLRAEAYNGYLYVMGGYNGTSYLNDVQYAKLNSDGSVGTWASTTNFPVARNFFISAVYNGYLYIVGGLDATYTYSTVQYAPLNANGTIGKWAGTSSFPTTINQLGGAVYNGYIYGAGGVDGAGTSYSSVQYAPLNSVPRVGHYSRLIDLGSAKTVTSITYNGTLPLTNYMVPVTYRAAGTDGVLGASTPLSGIGAGITARYLLVSFTFDDSATSVFPDTSSAAATVTDFTVNYAAAASHPSPAQRLRQGQTLQGGVLSPLDTLSP